MPHAEPSLEPALVKFAMSQVGGNKPSAEGGSSGGGKSGLVASLLGGLLKSKNKKSGSSNPLASLFGGSSKAEEEQDPLSAMLGGDDFESTISNLFGQVGLQNSSSVSGNDAPAYRPTTKKLDENVAILITGCQANETSVRITDMFPCNDPFYLVGNNILRIH